MSDASFEFCFCGRVKWAKAWEAKIGKFISVRSYFRASYYSDLHKLFETGAKRLLDAEGYQNFYGHKNTKKY